MKMHTRHITYETAIFPIEISYELICINTPLLYRRPTGAMYQSALPRAVSPSEGPLNDEIDALLGSMTAGLSSAPLFVGPAMGGSQKGDSIPQIENAAKKDIPLPDATARNPQEEAGKVE